MVFQPNMDVHSSERVVRKKNRVIAGDAVFGPKSFNCFTASVDRCLTRSWRSQSGKTNGRPWLFSDPRSSRSSTNSMFLYFRGTSSINQYSSLTLGYQFNMFQWIYVTIWTDDQGRGQRRLSWRDGWWTLSKSLGLRRLPRYNRCFLAEATVQFVFFCFSLQKVNISVQFLFYVSIESIIQTLCRRACACGSTWLLNHLPITNIQQ